MTVLTLENFRSFKGRHEINFSPITLLFGPNSVGKSSIIKALKKFNNLSIGDIYNGESSVFVQLNYDNEIIDFSCKEFTESEDIQLLNIINEKDWAFDFFKNYQLNAKSFFIKNGFSVSPQGEEVLEIQSKQFGINNCWLFEYSLDWDKYCPENNSEVNYIKLNLDHPIFEDNPFLKLHAPRESFKTLQKCFERLMGRDLVNAILYLSDIFDEKGLHFEKERNLYSLINIIESQLENKYDENYKRIHKCMPALLWILKSILKPMPDLDDIVHVGPLRNVPGKVNSIVNLPYNPMGGISNHLRNDQYTGETAWKSIFRYSQWNDLAGNTPSSLYGKRDDGELGKNISDWLINRFNIPYEIQFHVRYVFTTDSEEKVKKLHENGITRRDLLPEYAQIVFKNIQNGSVTPAEDIGVGISQLTPVIFNAIESKSFFVEQPELHIHPKMQTVLGDLFIFEGLYEKSFDDSSIKVSVENPNGLKKEYFYKRKSSNDQSQMIIETHSEHLLLRLLKRLREEIITPEDICIYYFENKSGKTQTTRIHVDKNGDFTTPWPEGFFEERLEELF